MRGGESVQEPACGDLVVFCHIVEHDDDIGDCHSSITLQACGGVVAHALNVSFQHFDCCTVFNVLWFGFIIQQLTPPYVKESVIGPKPEQLNSFCIVFVHLFFLLLVAFILLLYSPLL